MRAAVNLGLLCLDGLGTEVDYAAAIRWTKLAADAGHPVGLNNMGHIYENGLGVAVGTAEALRYYRLAAEQGYALGTENLDRLEAKLAEASAEPDSDKAIPPGGGERRPKKIVRPSN